MPTILYNTFHKILREWGHDVLIQRRIHERGTGLFSLPPDNNYFANKLEKWTVYSTFAGRKMSLADVQEERPEGWVHTVNMIYYFQATAKVKEGDRIYEPDDRYPPNNYESYIIEYARVVRDKGGKPLFYEVGVVRENEPQDA